MSKRVLNLKMDILGSSSLFWYFFIIFLGNRLEQRYMATSSYHRNTLRIVGNDIFQQISKTGQIMMKTVLSLKFKHIQIFLAFQVF